MLRRNTTSGNVTVEKVRSLLRRLYASLSAAVFDYGHWEETGALFAWNGDTHKTGELPTATQETYGQQQGWAQLI